MENYILFINRTLAIASVRLSPTYFLWFYSSCWYSYNIVVICFERLIHLLRLSIINWEWENCSSWTIPLRTSFLQSKQWIRELSSERQNHMSGVELFLQVQGSKNHQVGSGFLINFLGLLFFALLPGCFSSCVTLNFYN